MDIAWLRDLIIIIYGILGILLMIPIAILSVIVYRKVRDLLDSVEKTTDDAKDILETIRNEFVNPVSKMMAIFQVIKQTATMVADLMKKQQEDSNER